MTPEELAKLAEETANAGIDTTGMTAEELAKLAEETANAAIDMTGSGKMLPDYKYPFVYPASEHGVSDWPDS